MWIKQPDVNVTMSLLSVPVESNLKCQSFNSPFHIYTVLRPRALFFPEGPQGSEGRKSSRRRGWLLAMSGFKESRQPTV